MLLALALGLLLASVALIGEALTQPARERRAALRRALATRGVAAAGEEPSRSFRERVVDPAAARLAAIALRLSPRTSIESVRLRLLSAGMRETTPQAYLARKGAFTVGGATIGFLLGTASSGVAAIGFAAALGALGYVATDIRLSAAARRRREAVQADLPDALDLLGVSVEAGLGFDAALARLTEHMHGPLIDEFALALAEMRIGRSRHDALRGVAERVDAPELAAFVRAVVQADQLGMSLSHTLRVQAEDTRLRRQAAAEEKAMKAPVKMLFPTVAFIFPSMFLVILGPAMLNLTEVF